MSYRRLAIIPARAGSKGLKDKNIADLCGKPLIAYSIKAAIDSGIFDKIVVTTDSEKYAQIARLYGAEVLIRDKALSNDKATSFMVIEDVLKRIGKNYDYFVLLQPTSPLRNAHHIKEATTLFEKQCEIYDFLVSVKEADRPKVLCNPIDEDMNLKYFDADYSNYRRQSYKDYTPNGAIFLGKPDAYLSKKHFYGARSKAYIMDGVSSVDIDNMIDLELAKVLMNRI